MCKIKTFLFILVVVVNTMNFVNTEKNEEFIPTQQWQVIKEGKNKNMCVVLIFLLYDLKLRQTTAGMNIKF